MASPIKQVYDEIAIDNSKVYGHKNKPRNQEPSMFDLLTWKPEKLDRPDFKTNNPNILKSDTITQYKNKLSHTPNLYTSEAHDNYRRYHYDKENEVLLQEIDPEEIQELEKLKHQEQVEQEKRKQNILYQAQNVLLPDSADQQQESEVVVKKNVPQSQQASNYKKEHSYRNIQNKEQLGYQLLYNQLDQGKKVPKQIGVSNFHYVDQEEDEKQRAQDEQDKIQKEIDEQNQKQQENQEQGGFGKDGSKISKQKLLSQKKAKVLDPEYEKERLERRKDRIKQMERTTRWLPNSAFQTYFGKPAFENYGAANTKPAVGGMISGQYLMSHNVNPHRGQREPEYIQSYINALEYAERLPEPTPIPPRKRLDEIRESQAVVEEQKNRSSINPPKNDRQSIKFKKPDLVNSLRFASEENSPTSKQDAQVQNKAKKNAAQVLSEQVKNLKKEKNEQNQAQQQQQKKVVISEIQNAGQQQKDRTPQNGQQQQQASSLKQTVKKGNNNQNQKPKETENIEEYPERQFMKEVKDKKAKAQRIALKVTEVRPSSAQPGAGSVQNQSTYNQFNVQDLEKIDEMNPPEGYLQLLKDYELDPKAYKNVPPYWLQRIPYAGKKEYQNYKPLDLFK